MPQQFNLASVMSVLEDSQNQTTMAGQKDDMITKAVQLIFIAITQERTWVDFGQP